MVSPGVGPEEQGVHQHQVRDVELQRSGDRQPGHHQRTLRQEGGTTGQFRAISLTHELTIGSLVGQPELEHGADEGLPRGREGDQLGPVTGRDQAGSVLPG